MTLKEFLKANNATIEIEPGEESSIHVFLGDKELVRVVSNDLAKAFVEVHRKLDLDFHPEVWGLPSVEIGGGSSAAREMIARFLNPARNEET